MRVHYVTSACVTALLVSIVAPASAEAQFGGLIDRARRAVVDQAGNETELTVRDGVRCVVGDDACVARARSEGKTPVITDASGKVLVDENGRPITDPAKVPPGVVRAAAPAPAVTPAVADERPGTGALDLEQTPPGAASAEVNPFDSPDDDFDKFPVPGDLPPSAGTFRVPKRGPWNAMNFLGDMVCKGIVNLNLPLEPVRDAGTIEIRNGGQTLFADGFSDETEDITMQSVPGLIGRYAGVVAGSPGGVPMSIDYYWQIVTDEWIIGYLTSHVDTQGLTCDMFRTYELTYAGADRAGEPNERVQICHRPPGNPENARTITVGAPAVDAHLAHGDSLGACP